MVRKTKNLSVRAIIIPIFLANNQTVISLSQKNQLFWLVYTIISNLNAKKIKTKITQKIYF